MDELEPVAVSADEVDQFGCPYCNSCDYSIQLSGREGSAAICNNPTCKNRSFVILAKGITRSPFGFGPSRVHPELIPHPRAGTPTHGLADMRPDGCGDFFTFIDLRLKEGALCLVCRKPTHSRVTFLPTLFAGVNSRPAADRVFEIFKEHGCSVKLDLSARKPTVEAAACEVHDAILNSLRVLTADGIFTSEKLDSALAQPDQTVYVN
jgi:hypothetical protein